MRAEVAQVAGYVEKCAVYGFLAYFSLRTARIYGPGAHVYHEYFLDILPW